MRFIQFAVRKGAKPVCIDCLDFRRPLNSIRSCPIGGNVKGLVRVLRVVVVIRSENLVLGIQVVVDPAKKRTVAYRMIYRCPILLAESALHEVHKSYSLTVWISQNLRVRAGSAIERDA